MTEETVASTNEEEKKNFAAYGLTTVTVVAVTSIVDSLTRALIKAGSLTKDDFASELVATIAHLKAQKQSDYCDIADEIVEQFLKNVNKPASPEAE